MPFSWDRPKKHKIAKDIARAIIQSKGNINSDFDVMHPDWIRLAKWDGTKFTGNHNDLKIKVKDNIVRLQDRSLERRKKIAG